jgi:hypothetical protein
LIKLLFTQCSLMLASEPKYPELGCFNNIQSAINQEFQITVFKYLTVHHSYRFLWVVFSIKSTLAFIKSFWSNSRENQQISWFINSSALPFTSH